MTHVIRIALSLTLVPLFAMVVPIVFLAAWIGETLDDRLARRS
jgi:hypothetical protein